LISDYFADYVAVLIAAILGVVVVASALIGNRILAPRNPTRDKGVTYECGMLPIGRSRAQVHFRYYLFAILFLIFDIEAVFLLGDGGVYHHPGFRAFVCLEEGCAALELSDDGR
jgi:NADH:ubiquinone oxidoreductase subunit 3 (subunit A)